MCKLTSVPVVLAVAFAASAGLARAEDNDALIKRGKYLVEGPVACGNCHNARGPDMAFIPGKEFAGGFHIVDLAFDVYSANITPDKETGIGGWTDEQIIRAIREGVDKEGKVIFPPMPAPTYNSMSDDDVKAIVAYLHTIPAVKNKVEESKWNIPQKAMPPAKGTPAPDKSDRVAYGKYIVTALAHCFECHSSPDAHGAPDMTKMGGGGFHITLVPGKVDFMSANITPDPETGIGKWTDDQIKKAMTEGVDPQGHHLSPPMPFDFFKKMSAEDLDAVVAYIRTIPPITNKVERTAFQKQVFPN